MVAVGALLGVKLAVVLASLGAAGFVLALRPRSAPNQFLAAFFALIGAGYAFDAAWTIADVAGDYALGLRLLRIEMIFNVLDPLVLLYFLTIYPRRNRLNDPRLFAALGLVASYLLVNVILSPRSFAFTDPPFVTPAGASIFFYPLERLVYNLLIIGVYGTCFALALAAGRAGVLPRRAPATLLFVAVSVALLPRIGFALVDIVDPLGLGVQAFVHGTALWEGVFPRDSLASALIRLAIGLGVLAWGGVLLHRHGRELATSWKPPLLIATVFMAPFTFDLAQLVARRGAYVEALVFINSVAFAARWLLFAGCFGAAFLYAQLYDVERRLRRAALVAVVLAALTLLIGVSMAAVAPTFRASPPILLAAGVTLVAAGGATPLTQRALMRAFPRADDPDYLAERRIEVFQGAIHEARTRGRDPLTDAHLVRFRRRLGLSEEVHRRLAERVSPDARARAVTLMPGELTLGRYRIERMIGAGSAGRTWSAHDEVLDRTVAIKQIFGRPPEDGGTEVAHVVKQAMIAGRLNHPNVVAMLDAQPMGVDHLLIMEHVADGTLETAMRRRGTFSPRETAALLDGILAGLDAVHGARILHRDIKPANILLTAQGSPKLADFGVALLLDATEATASRGPVGQPGTLRYMAPEQAAGLAVGVPTDLFAAAVVAHECLTGRPFVETHGPPDLIRQAVLRPVADFTGTSASSSLRGVIARALEPRPEDRYQSARELRRALSATDEMRARD